VENKLQLTIADLLTPAISKYGYPLFVRRYPGKLEDFACDLFFGKPVLVVEHHRFFRDGGTSLLDFVSKLNSLTRELEWAGLRDVVVRTYLERDVSDRLRICQIYTNDQLIENEDGWARNYVIMKHEDGDVPVEKVLINGEGSRFTLSNNRLRLFVRIPAKRTASVRIVYRNTLPASNGRECLTARGRLWGRRLLSELRDNVLCRNELLLAAAYGAKRKLFSSLAPR
jgi:hypothetical protein